MRHYIHVFLFTKTILITLNMGDIMYRYILYRDGDAEKVPTFIMPLTYNVILF